MKKLFFLPVLVFVSLVFFGCGEGSGAAGLTPTTDGTALWWAGEEGQTLWGYINASGKMVISPRFNDAYPFSCGLAMIEEEDGTPNFINPEGKVVSRSKPEGSYDAYFYYNTCGFKDGNLWGMVDNNFKTLFYPRFTWLNYMTADGLASAREEGDTKDCYINKNGKKVIAARYDDAYNFVNGVAVVKINGNYKLIDLNGEDLTPSRTRRLENLGDGRIAFENETSGKWGMIDKSGNDVCAAQFVWIEAFSEGLAVAQRGTKLGYINHSGEDVIAPSYFQATPFHEGVAWILANNTESARWELIDKSGNSLFALGKNEVPRQVYHNGLCLIYSADSNSYAYIDKSGNTVYTWKTSNMNAPAKMPENAREKIAAMVANTELAPRFLNRAK